MTIARDVIRTPGAAAPGAHYSQGIRSGDLVFTAGCVGVDPATGAVAEGGFEAQVHRAIANVRATLQAAGSDLEHVVKTLCFVTRRADFAALDPVYRDVLPGRSAGPFDRRLRPRARGVPVRDRGRRAGSLTAAGSRGPLGTPHADGRPTTTSGAARPPPRGDGGARGDRRATAACWVALDRGAGAARVRGGRRVQPRRRAAPRLGARQIRGARRPRSASATRRRARRRASACSGSGPVFTTPNVFAPAAFEQTDVDGDAEFRELVEPQHCYVCKQQYAEVHHFYDQLCPAVRRLQLRQAHRAGRPARPRRAAHRRPREDRLPGRAQAAARRRAADRHDALPARLGGALRAGAGLRRVGRSARDLRPRSAPHAERRGVLPRTCSRPATGSTSSSTTPARRCAGRPTSTRT